MSRFRIRSVPWIPLIVLATLGVPACAETPLGPDSTRVRAERRLLRSDGPLPFFLRADVQLTGAVVPPPEPCLQFANSTIVGEATHLGTFEGVGSTCILSLAPDPDPPFEAPGPPPYATATFTNPRWTLTAASGDQLWLETTEAVTVLSGDNSLRSRGEQRIVGGTGRFEGATGRLVAEAVNEDGQGPDAFRARGWIRLATRPGQ